MTFLESNDEVVPVFVLVIYTVTINDVEYGPSQDIHDWSSIINHTCFFPFNFHNLQVGDICFVNRVGDVFFENCVDMRLFHGHSFR